MISIKRGDCPEFLTHSTSETRYRDKNVVGVLWEMQHGKCCYCEMRLPPEGAMKNVEHFRPKSIFPSLKNEWNYLLLACVQCNVQKSDKFPVIINTNGNPEIVDFQEQHEPAIIDPCEINPEEHIDFVLDKDDDPIIREKNGSLKGRATIDTIGLASYFNAQRHRDRYDELENRYMQLLAAKNRASFQKQKDYFVAALAPDATFAALNRAYARYRKLDRRFGLTIPCFAPGDEAWSAPDTLGIQIRKYAND